MSIVGKVGSTILAPVKKAGGYVCKKSKFANSVFTEVAIPMKAMRVTRARTIDLATRAQAGTNPNMAKKACNWVVNQSKGFGKGMFALVKKAGPISGVSAIAGCVLAWRFAPFLPGTSIGLATSVILKTLFKTIFRV